jgi:hypothetical protein
MEERDVSPADLWWFQTVCEGCQRAQKELRILSDSPLTDAGDRARSASTVPIAHRSQRAIRHFHGTVPRLVACST